MATDIIDQISHCTMVKNIPSNVGHLLKVMTREDTDINELVELLRLFPVICARLLKVANSAWAAPKTEITDIKHAFMQLGSKMVKSITIAILVGQQFNTQKCKGFSEQKFWLSSLITADLMQHLEENENNDASTAYLIGLIHNIGLLAIADITPEAVSQAFLIADNSQTSFSIALENTVGTSYLSATQIILENWGIPTQITNTYSKSAQASPYSTTFQSALQHKQQIDLSSMPLQAIEKNNDFIINTKIIEKSDQYDELCGLYCR